MSPAGETVTVSGVTFAKSSGDTQHRPFLMSSKAITMYVYCRYGIIFGGLLKLLAAYNCIKAVCGDHTCAGGSLQLHAS